MQSPGKAALHGVTVRHDFVTEQLIKAQWHRPELKMVDEGDSKLTVPKESWELWFQNIES